MRHFVVVSEPSRQHLRNRLPLISAVVLVLMSISITLALAISTNDAATPAVSSAVRTTESTSAPSGLGTAGTLAGFALLGGWAVVGGLMFTRADRRRVTVEATPPQE